MAATDVTKNLTLLEVLNRVDPEGRLHRIAETASKKVPLMQYLPWIPANGKDVHEHLQRLTQPTGSWTAPNEYIDPHSSRTKPVREPLTYLEDFNNIDLKHLAKYSDPLAFRATEDEAFKAGMMEEWVSKFIYGDRKKNPKHPQGLANRDEFDAASDTQVIDAGGSGSTCMSAWLIKFDQDDGVFAFYPEGDPNSMVEQDDLGNQLLTDSNGRQQLFAVTHHKIYSGFGIRDPRNVVRIASLATSGTSNILDGDVLAEGFALIHDIENMVILTNRTGWSQLQKSAQNRVNVNYEADSPWGRRWVRDYNGIPIVINDALTTAETAL